MQVVYILLYDTQSFKKRNYMYAVKQDSEIGRVSLDISCFL